MRYEVKFMDESMLNKVVVNAVNEDTAIFIAGMLFSDMDLNPERLEMLEVEAL